MVASILCVCTGNICRSPIAAAALYGALPDIDISSAGLHALEGHDIDPESARAALARGISLPAHSARQFSTALGERAELILAMDKTHRNEITHRWPYLSGKTLLLGHFENGKPIADPYRMGMEMHQRAVDMILESVPYWVELLAKMRD